MALEFQPGSTSLVFLRHGEPEVYGADESSLSARGRGQVRAITLSFAEIILRDNSRVRFELYHGSKRRTQESAEQGYLALVEATNGFESPISLTPPTYHPIIDQGLSLNPLFKAGIAPENVYQIWITSPEEDLIALGIQTPSQVYERMMREIQHETSFSTEFNTDRQAREARLKMLLCHETSIGAVVKNNFPELGIKIAPAEPLIATRTQNHDIEFIFRGKSVVAEAHPDLTQPEIHQPHFSVQTGSTILPN